MPMYNFACKKCKCVHEVFVPLDKLDTKIKCPECKEKLRRMLPCPTFKINGTLEGKEGEMR